MTFKRKAEVLHEKEAIKSLLHKGQGISSVMRGVIAGAALALSLSGCASGPPTFNTESARQALNSETSKVASMTDYYIANSFRRTMEQDQLTVAQMRAIGDGVIHISLSQQTPQYAPQGNFQSNVYKMNSNAVAYINSQANNSVYEFSNFERRVVDAVRKIPKTMAGLPRALVETRVGNAAATALAVGTGLSVYKKKKRERRIKDKLKY